MAISRVSDLPKIDNEWQMQESASAPNSENSQTLRSSLLEVSWKVDDGKFESKSIDVKTIQDFISQSIAERDEFNNNVSMYNGANLSGHVGINEDADINTINSQYGIYAKGSSNIIESKVDIRLAAKTNIAAESDNIDIAASKTANITTVENLNLQSEGTLRTAAGNTFIGSDISTCIVGSSPDDVYFATSKISAESVVPLVAPTPLITAIDTSKQVVNIEYLYKIFYDKIKNDIIEELSQGGTPTPTPTPSGDTYYGLKVGELKTFDYDLSDDDRKVNGKTVLYKLGSNVQAADAPQLAALLSQAQTSKTVVCSGISVACMTDNKGHYVIRDQGVYDNTAASVYAKCGTYWFYYVNGTTIRLPKTSMYFRAGDNSTSTTSVGTFINPAFPGISDQSQNNILTKVIKLGSGVSRLHNGNSYSYYVKPTSLQLAYKNQNNWQYDNDTGLVAPPSVQTYTYMVCY